MHAGGKREAKGEGQPVKRFGDDLLAEDRNTDGREERSHGEQRLHGDAIHGHVLLHEVNHLSARHANDEGRDEGEQDVRDPRVDEVNQRQRALDLLPVL